MIIVKINMYGMNIDLNMCFMDDLIRLRDIAASDNLPAAGTIQECIDWRTN